MNGVDPSDAPPTITQNVGLAHETEFTPVASAGPGVGITDQFRAIAAEVGAALPSISAHAASATPIVRIVRIDRIPTSHAARAPAMMPEGTLGRHQYAGRGESACTPRSARTGTAGCVIM